MLIPVVIACSAAAAGLLALSSLTSGANGSTDMLRLYEKKLETARKRAAEMARREAEAQAQGRS